MVMENIWNDSKSKFDELFGDLKFDKNGWGYEKLNDLCDVRDGTHESPKYIINGRYPLLTSQNFTKGFMDLTKINYISKHDFDSINLRSKVDVGDIVMPMIGTVGSPVIIEENIEFAIKNLALIKFNGSKTRPEYIRYILDSDYFKNIVLSNNRGSNRMFVSLGDLRELPILMAPYDLQNEFSIYASKYDKLKFDAQQQITLLENEREKLIEEEYK